MSRLLPLTLLAALTAVGPTGCYSERLPPSYFRNSCGNDGECGDDESCVSGLCQVPCTMATATEDCGLSSQGGAYLACINGACASACSLDDDPCPGSQSCGEIPILTEQLGAGICMEECSADSCPDGEVCVLGFCATACDPADPSTCAEGEICEPAAGICLPSDLPETSTGDGDTESQTETGGDTE